MRSWQSIATEAMVSGTIASLLSALMLAACGRVERGSAAAPNSAPSQWIRGEHAAYERRPALRHTALGYCVHHSMSVFWAAIHEACFDRRRGSRSVPRDLRDGVLTAALACLVDYTVTPRRFRPGFEKHLGKRSLLLVYAAFGAGLAIPRLVAQATFRA